MRCGSAPPAWRPRPCFCRSRSCNWRRISTTRGKVGAVFDVELGLFLFQLAVPGVNLLEQRGGEVAAFGLQARIGGNDQLRIALRGRAILRLAQNAVRGGRHQLRGPAHPSPARPRCAGVSPGWPLASISGVIQQAMLPLEGRQPLLILLHARLQLLELALQPLRGLSGGLHARLACLAGRRRQSRRSPRWPTAPRPGDRKRI